MFFYLFIKKFGYKKKKVYVPKGITKNT